MRRLLLGLAIASIAALSPCWVHADDQQIAQQIVQQLRQQKAEGNLSGFGIDLEVDSGIVWLKGHVTSGEQQAMVLDIARNVSGVEQVVNDLQIQASTTEAEKPQARVRPALLKSESSSSLLPKPGKLLTNLNRSVQRAFRPEARNRRRPAHSVSSRLRASSLPAADHDEPSCQLRPRTAVTPPVAPTAVKVPVAQTKPTAPSDSQLAEEIIGKLRTQKDRGTLRNFDVDVQVNNRVVWISGRVASEAQQSLVLDISRRVRGVKQVVNDLQVSSSAPVHTVSAPLTLSAAGPGNLLARNPLRSARQSSRPKPRPRSPTLRPSPRRPPAPQRPLAFAPAQSVAYTQQMMGQPMAEVPAAAGVARARFDNPSMPGYAWPSYAAYPNYGAVTYPRQYSPTAWPYIGPFYPYPQVPLGWRKVTLEWDDGWWMLDFKSK